MNLRNLSLALSLGLLVATSAQAEVDLLFTQSDLPIDQLLLIQHKVVPGQFAVTQWFPNPHGPLDLPVDSWEGGKKNVGDFTGFYPQNNHASQRGVSPAWYGATAVQAEKGTIGFMIHTWSAGTALNSLVPIVADYAFSRSNKPRPFLRPDRIASLSIDLQIPGEYDDRHAIPYATLYLYVVDTVHNLAFWYGAGVYDSRGTASELVMYDEGTKTPIVGAVAGQGGRYSTKLGGSAAFQGTTWAGYKTFHFGVSAQNLANAVADVVAQFPASHAKLSLDPADYAISEVNFNPEIARQGGNGWLGLSFRNFRLEVLDAPQQAEGFFKIDDKNAIYHSNGYDAYCVFTSWDLFLSWGGSVQAAQALGISPLPSKAINRGNCKASAADTYSGSKPIGKRASVVH